MHKSASSNFHILYLIQYFGVPDDSAVASRSFEFVRYWSQAGARVTVVASSAFINDRQKLGKWFNDNVDLRIVRQPYHNRMSAVQRLTSFLGFYIKGMLSSLSVQNVDLVYASSTPLSVALLGKHLAHIFKVPFFLELRDLWPDFPIEMGAVKSEPLKRWLYKTESRLYEAATHIVTLSPTASQRLVRNKGVDSERISSIPNGTTYPYFRPRKTKSQLTRTGGRHLVIYAGTLGKANNVEWIMRFINQALRINKRRNFHFAIIGDGSELSKVRKWHRSQPVSRRPFIQLVPMMSRVEVANWFIAADFSLITYKPLKSLQATSPNKFFNSLSGGAIPITNHTGWVGQLTENWKLGIVDSDPQSAAKRMLELAENKNLKSTYHRNLLSAARLFRRDEMAETLFSLFKEHLPR